MSNLIDSITFKGNEYNFSDNEARETLGNIVTEIPASVNIYPAFLVDDWFDNQIFDGFTTQNTNHCYTKQIAVKSNTRYSMTHNPYKVATDSGEILVNADIGLDLKEVYCFTTPANCTGIYIAIDKREFGGTTDINTAVENFNSVFMLVEGGTLPTEFVPYVKGGYKLKDNVQLPDGVEIPNVPTKVSELENDIGFITADGLPKFPDIPEVEVDLSDIITIEEAVSSHTANYMPDTSEFVGGWISKAGKFTSSSNNMITPFIAIDESLIGKKLTVQRIVSGVWERIGQIKSVTAFTDIIEPDASGMFNSNNVIEALNDVTRNSSDGSFAVYTIPEGTKYIRVAVGNAVVTQSVNQPMFVINDDESILGEYVANESVSIEGKKELVDDIMVNASNLSENAMEKISEEINVDSAKPLRVSALSRMFTCADETEDFISVIDTYLKTANKTAWLYGLYDELVTAYPEYVTRTQIATTATPTLPIYKSDGTERTDITSGTVFPMYRYDFTPPISAKTNDVVNSLEKEITLPKILYTGGIHGGEYLQVIAAYRFFKMLCEKWQKYEMLEDLRWNVHFVVIPLTNPFGFNYPSGRYTADGIGVSKLNERNVDISGNFPSDNYEPSTNSKYGTTALSEPESVAIYNIIQNEDFILGIDNHTYGYLGTEYSGEHMGAYFIANHTKHPQSTEFWFKIGRWLNSRVRKLSPDIANTSFKNSDLSQLWTDHKDQMLNNTFRSVGANIEMPISIDPVSTTHEDASTGLLPMAEETQAYCVDLLATVFYEALNDFYTY